MPSPAPKDPLLGRTIALRYRLISRLGAGSVASVYLARHVLIERLGAIKIVHPELARDPVWRERFLREARAVNRINHPNIVEITDLGEADGLLFLVMEYVPGESLKQILERGPLGWRQAAALGVQIASALGRAHQMGVVHRGLDPSNVLVVSRRDGGDLVKLIDFGVAKLADAAPLTLRASAVTLSGGTVVPHIDFTGLSELDARSDLFALGAVLYEATAGAPPAPFAAAPLPDAPAFFSEVVSTLLAPEPDDRPRDGFEAADLLARALERDAPLAAQAAPPSIPIASGPQQGSWWPLLDGGASPGPARRDSAAPPSTDPARGDARRVGVAIERLAPQCAAALAALEQSIGGRGLGAEPRAALDEARRLCTTVAVVSELVASDTGALEAVQARGRGARADLGRKLDEVAREHSRTLGWAGTIAERSYLVEAQRASGEHPVPVIEAMVWEQAALEQEEDRARENAARLAAEMSACQAEIERHTERLEHEILVFNACLEGRIGALRALSSEAWAALENAAARAGVAPPPRR
jgi:eukaryotic-like serine/threonine-protein kinase